MNLKGGYLSWIMIFSIFLSRSESKGTITTKDLSEASALADSINKAIKVLETKNMIDEQSKYHTDLYMYFNFILRD